MRSVRKSSDVLISGGGVAGYSAAVALAERGLKVIVVTTCLPGEASPRAAGIIDPFLGLNSTNPLLKLTLEAYRYFPGFIRRLEKETGMKVEYKRLGMTYIALTGAEETVLKKKLAWQKKLSVSVKWLSKRELEKKIPGISPRALGGLYYPSLERINSKLFMKALEAYARNLGVKIIRTKERPRLRKSDSGFFISLKQGNVFGRAGIIASGAWSSKTSPFKKGLPVEPVRGQIFVVKSPLFIDTMVHSADDAYLVPRESGDYLLGSTVESAGFRALNTASAKKEITRKIQTLIPGLVKIKFTGGWAGLRPRSSDLYPLIGRLRGEENLYAATGYFRSGILLGPYCGQVLADLMTRGTLPAVMKPFTPGRFAV